MRKPIATSLCVAAGIASAMCFVVSAQGYVGMSDAPASATSFLWSALALCFAFLFVHVYVRKGFRAGVGTAAFGLLFGFVNTVGGMLFAYDSLASLNGMGAWAAVLVRSTGQALPMIAALVWVDGFLRSGALHQAGALERWQPKRCSWLLRFYRRHPIVSLMLLLVLCWSPYLIAFFPGTVCWDLGEMVAQFFGQRPMDTWHPVFTTWLMGGCVWLGRLVGSDNVGAALFTLLQTTLLAYALASVVGFFDKLHLNRATRLCAILFFALTPLWGGYAQFISKDTLYTAAMLLFALRVMEILLMRERKQGPPAPRMLVGLFAWALLCCLLRSNGLYVVLPTAVLLVMVGAQGKARLPLGGALAGAVALALLFTNALLPDLGVRDETASGLYSVCFQQTARVLRDHAAEVSPEEYAEIDRVLDAEHLPALYEPWISDPVKYTFKQYGQGKAIEQEALARYRKTWLSMLSKYPLSYVEAFFAGNVSYYTFMPKIEGETYNNQAGNRLVFETYALGEDPRFLHTTQPAKLEGLRTLLAVFARGWRHIPLLSLLYTCAVYTWLLVGAGLSLARRKKWRLLVGFLPALLSLGVCMLSPVNDYFRYFLPIVAMTLPLLGSAAAQKDACTHSLP
ncbi:MAG: DUF6020 family protein [Clostridia bacterium]